jgi:hypothetical protein
MGQFQTTPSRGELCNESCVVLTDCTLLVVTYSYRISVSDSCVNLDVTMQFWVPIASNCRALTRSVEKSFVCVVSTRGVLIILRCGNV